MTLLKNENMHFLTTLFNIKGSSFFHLFKGVIAFLVFSASLYGQTPLREQFEYSEKLYSEEYYFDAITEAKRLKLFDIEREYEFLANMLIGNSYKKGGHLTEAADYFTKAIMCHKTKEELYTSKTELIKINILRRRIHLALKQISELEADTAFYELKNEFNYWRGWAHIFNDDWEKGGYYFGLSDSADYLENFCFNIENQKYSVTFAKAISYVLPGAGQIYTGEYLNGVLSLGWNLFSAYVTINSFIAERVFDGFISLSFFWSRFYVGNVMNAESFAISKNKDIINKAMLYLQTNYEGKKP